MTAHSGNEARKACAAAGMDDYVTKPVDFAELSATLARVARPVTREFPAGAGSSASKPPSSAGDSLGLIQPAEPLRRLGGDEPLFLEVLSIFAAESAGRRAAFEAARDGRDVESLRRLAHALRGSAKTVGAESLALRATELETLAGGTARMAPVGKASPVPEFSEGISLAVTALLALLESTVEAARAILPPGYVAPTDDI
jgi:HPt (histidine-containing phosphotransfer) domain-containing protein